MEAFAWCQTNLARVTTVFKPSFHNFRAPFGDHAADLIDLIRLEAAVERDGKIIQPDLALVAGLEHVVPEKNSAPRIWIGNIVQAEVNPHGGLTTPGDEDAVIPPPKPPSQTIIAMLRIRGTRCPLKGPDNGTMVDLSPGHFQIAAEPPQ